MHTITFPNSPGTEVTVTRGGIDPTSSDPLPDQWVTLTWIDETGTEQVRGFLGP